MIINEFAKYLADNIEELVHGNITDANVYMDHLPEDDSLAVMVEGTGGFPLDMKLVDYIEPTIRILVRGTRNTEETREMCQAIIDTVGALGDTTMGDYTLIRCQAIQPQGIPIGRDENKRARYSINFETEFKKGGLSNG